MAYIHDPYPWLSRPPYQRMGADPLSLPWANDPGAVLDTYGPYVGSGMNAQVPPPYQPVGAGELAGFGITTLALAAGAIWLGYQIFGGKKRKNPSGRRWIKGTIKRPGAFTAYMRRRYGQKAFTARGTIKMSYVDKVINDPNVSSRVHKQAVLARTLKSM